MKNSTFPVVVIDDDQDDIEIFEAAYAHLGFPDPLKTFKNPSTFLADIRKNEFVPFLVISDFNMPQINGVELKKILNADSDLRFRSIPFVIWTTAVSPSQMKIAYENMAQGYFEKPASFEQFSKQLQTLINYWEFSKTP